MLKNVCIIGSGSWGTALTKLFSDSRIKVSWLVRDKEQADFINTNGHNPRYLSSARLNKKFVFPVTDPEPAVKNSEIVIFAVPSVFLADVLKNIDAELLINKTIGVSIKGLIPETGMVPSRYIATQIKNLCKDFVVVGGPCHAEEIASQRSTYITIGGRNPVLVNLICKSLRADYIHPRANNDPTGIEYASIMKNIIGIATGIADGLQYGDNFQAVLISNSMREAGHLLDCVDAGDRNLFDSVYFGDLLVTAYSHHSRNRSLGKLIGRGICVNKALQGMEMIAEGFNASKELATTIKQYNVRLPVINAIHRILHQRTNPFHEFKLLENQLS